MRETCLRVGMGGNLLRTSRNREKKLSKMKKRNTRKKTNIKGAAIRGARV